jgi:putative endonuclease
VPHYFYLARCHDGSLYAGTCVNVKEREAKHNDGTGAKYTRSRRPVKIIYTEEFETLSEARKREIEVKKMRKEEKEALTSKEGTESKESKDRL